MSYCYFKLFLFQYCVVVSQLICIVSIYRLGNICRGVLLVNNLLLYYDNRIFGETVLLSILLSIGLVTRFYLYVALTVLLNFILFYKGYDYYLFTRIDFIAGIEDHFRRI